MPYNENVFTGIIAEDGTICDAGRNRREIGIDKQRESELLEQIRQQQERLDEYYDKLVEVGVITPPKTPEQLLQEQAVQQQEINAALLEAIGQLKEEMGALRNGIAGYGDGSREQPVGQDSTGAGKRPGTGKKRGEQCSETSAENP